jgi:Flp pilus assembly pilin Flp
MIRWAISKYARLAEFRRAQTLTEYVLVLTAIAIAALIAFQSFGTTISTDVSNIASDF